MDSHTQAIVLFGRTGPEPGPRASFMARSGRHLPSEAADNPTHISPLPAQIVTATTGAVVVALLAMLLA